ncbi:MAG: phage portal protein [Victivallaceae bacterium]|nr:phage portal protein [Victivallaceae bacterium]
MAKKKTNKTPNDSKNLVELPDGSIASFSFGDPEAVHNERILDYLGTFPNSAGEYYEPPIPLSGLSRMRRANGHHGSCILFRRNMTANAYAGGGLTAGELRSAATDLLTFGNAYIQTLRNAFGYIAALRHIPAINMRVRTDNKGFRRLLVNGTYQDFTHDEVIQITEYDTDQQIYGLPDWIGGLQSALLNQDATLFRRRYYVNGAHLGYILYTSDPKMDPNLVKQMQEKIKQGKGIGNFRSLHVHIPNGVEKAFQIIPIGEIKEKDEFLNIKNISAADVREAHRVPPVLMGIVPQGTSSLGDPEKVERVYIRTEVRAMAQPFMNINELLPSKLQLKFNFKTETEDPE